MENEKRLVTFINDLDKLINDNSWYDDDNNCEVMDITEDEAYNTIMQNYEYHLLGTDVVKYYIKVFINDFNERCNVIKYFRLN